MKKEKYVGYVFCNTCGQFIREINGRTLKEYTDNLLGIFETSLGQCPSCQTHLTLKNLSIEVPTLRCEGCGRLYTTFPDFIIPDSLWVLISPRHDFSGILCPLCIAERLDNLDGLWYDFMDEVQKYYPQIEEALKGKIRSVRKKYNIEVEEEIWRRSD